MEPHAVPQNITQFEFKLVGDMTLKQFIYLAIGVGVAYLSFVFLAARLPFFAWPVIVISSFLGVAFAFIPISDRPLDHWVGAFLKAIYQPTQRAWKRRDKAASGDPLFASRLNVYLSSKASQLTPQVQLQQLVAAKAAVPYAPSPKPAQPQPLPSTSELEKTVELGKEAQTLQVKILETERNLQQIRAQASSSQDPKIYTETANKTFDNLQNLVKEASEIKARLQDVTGENQKPQAPKLTVVAPKPKTTTQLTLTSFPNVINGIVADPVGNYLENAIVVIHDKDGLPVRALKTNKLGQFSGSTPLPNGTYTVEIEKDDLVFDVLQIELKGAVLSPITIAAKQVAGVS